jgi:hypothetical protein
MVFVRNQLGYKNINVFTLIFQLDFNHTQNAQYILQVNPTAFNNSYTIHSKYQSNQFWKMLKSPILEFIYSCSSLQYQLLLIFLFDLFFSIYSP